jgi:hypothetical protein
MSMSASGDMIASGQQALAMPTPLNKKASVP